MKKAFLVCLLFLVGFPLYSQWTVDELYNYYEPEGDFSLPKKIEIKGKYTTEDATAKNCKFWVMHYDDIFFSLRIFENVNSPDETFIGEGREVNVFIRKPSGWYVKTIFETRKYGIAKAVSREALDTFFDQRGEYLFLFSIRYKQENMVERTYWFTMEFE